MKYSQIADGNAELTCGKVVKRNF